MTAHLGEVSSSDWYRARAKVLRTLDDKASLDDLEPLRDIIGEARVVAIGEGAHFVSEFASARIRLLRFLVERCGFTMLVASNEFSRGPGFLVTRRFASAFWQIPSTGILIERRPTTRSS